MKTAREILQFLCGCGVIDGYGIKRRFRYEPEDALHDLRELVDKCKTIEEVKELFK